MPSCFARFLDDDELRRVRALYIESLDQPALGERDALDKDEARAPGNADSAPATAPAHSGKRRR